MQFFCLKDVYRASIPATFNKKNALSVIDKHVPKFDSIFRDIDCSLTREHKRKPNIFETNSRLLVSELLATNKIPYQIIKQSPIYLKQTPDW